MFSITAKKREDYSGFFRAGIFWPDTETIVDSLPYGVLDEPMLIVKEIKESKKANGKKNQETVSMKGNETIF